MRIEAWHWYRADGPDSNIVTTVRCDQTGILLRVRGEPKHGKVTRTEISLSEEETADMIEALQAALTKHRELHPAQPVGG